MHEVCSPALPVGQLVDTAVPLTDEFIERLQEVLASNESLDSLARVTYDPRMPLERWRRVVHVELLQLYEWAIQRLQAAMAPQELLTSCLPTDSIVLVLLPRYGFAIHVIRRAMMFAALGLQTFCGFPTDEMEEGARCVTAIAKQFGLQMALRCATEECPRLAFSLDAETTTVIVTGRQETVRQVRENLKASRVLGCTGKCSVVVGRDREQIEHLGKQISLHQLPQSCSRLASILLIPELSPDAPVRVVGGEHLELDGTSLGHCLGELHPSVVITPSDPDPQASVTTHLCGYRLFLCDRDGEPQRREGFAADPLFGWPGDYLA